MKEPSEPRQLRGLNAKQALAVLEAAFRIDSLPEPTVKLYVLKLSDIEPALLQATVNDIIARTRFFPSIAEIRETAGRLAGLLPLGPDEALRIIREADTERAVYRRDGSFAYTEREWLWPEELDRPSLALIRRALARVGDPVDASGRRHFGWEKHFTVAYEHVAAEAKTAALADLSAAMPTALTPGVKLALDA